MSDDLDAIRQQMGTPRGHRKGRPKDAEKVRTMMLLYDEGYSLSQIAAAYGNTSQAVWGLIRRHRNRTEGGDRHD